MSIFACAFVDFERSLAVKQIGIGGRRTFTDEIETMSENKENMTLFCVSRGVRLLSGFDVNGMICNRPPAF